MTPGVAAWAAWDGLGVISVLPVGKNGWRLLRGIPVGGAFRDGVAGRIDSSSMSRSSSR